MIKWKQWTAALSASVCLLAAFWLPADAAGVWHSYTYANNGDVVFSPDIYEVEQVVYGARFAEEALVGSQDMCFDTAGDLYILDAENKSVIITDADLKLKKHITAFTKDGADSPLLNPTGIFVDRQKRIYICDGGNRRIVRADSNGTIDLEILKPEADYFPEGVEFIPKKLIMDSAGNMYVSAIGISDGMVMFDPSGEFIGFYGSPKVASTLELLTDYFWRQFMTEEQKETMANYVPPEVANFCITADDFIVTITNSYWNTDGLTKVDMDEISMLNPKGIDVLEFDTGKNPGKAISEDAKRLNFVAVCTDTDGFMSFVDNRQGKIYQFDQRMNLIAAFGAIGSQDGTFQQPVAIATHDKKLYVLDGENGSVTVFRLTEYGRTIHHAISVYSTEKQSEVIGPWQEVLKLNANYDLAYVGIGDVLLNQGDYRGAMEYFELGNDSSRYNAAFKQMRLIFLRENLLVIMIVIVLLAAGVKVLRVLWRKRVSRRKEHKE